MNEENMINSENPIPPNAVSLYGDNASMDDFPVLKAFQQYIDAEQAKARKRMVSLSIFFGVLIVALAAFFLFLLREANTRNQNLNDRLIEFSEKDRERTVTAAKEAAEAAREAAREATEREQARHKVEVEAKDAAIKSKDEALKSMTDNLAALRKQMDDEIAKNQAKIAAAEKAAAEQAKKSSAKEIPPEEIAKLQRARELLQAEKQRLAAEKERLHQEQVDLQRRRLYPEYYEQPQPVKSVRPAAAKPAAVKSATVRPAAKKVVVEEEIDDTDDEYDEDLEEEMEEENEENVEEDDSDVSDDSAIDYFKDDEYKIPVEVKGKKIRWNSSLK